MCLKTYSEDGDDEQDHDMVACDNCDYWVHVGCDEALTPERYQKLCDDEDEKYSCPLCEKRVKANVDTGQAALALKGVSAPSGTCVGMAGGKASQVNTSVKCAQVVGPLTFYSFLFASR